MHRFALALAFLIAVPTTAFAQKRNSEVTLGPKISVRVVGLKKSNAQQLEERLKDFQKRGEFKVDSRKKQLTFCLKPQAQVSFSELKQAAAGDDKRFKLVFSTVKLVGKMSLSLEESVLMKIQGKKRWQLARQLRNIKGVSGLRPGNGTIDLTVAPPGQPITNLDKPIASAAKLDKGQSAITDATWHGPAEGEEKKGSGRKGKRGKKGSKKKAEEGDDDDDDDDDLK